MIRGKPSSEHAPPGASASSAQDRTIVDAFADLAPVIAPTLGLPPGGVSDRHAVLSDELHHRVQNTLAIVLALARLTARSVSTTEEFQVAFGDRVQAMARTNSLLLRGQVQAIDVRAALETELEPYRSGGGAVTLDCEPMGIDPDAALSLSLLIHELATNAAKYGALSGPGGVLAIRCVRGPDGGLIDWVETSPVPVTGPKRTGAGSVLISRLARDLGGAAELDFRSSGLTARITFSLDPGAAEAAAGLL
ncbi:sensor histidine kinase [Phenylobacterium sp.]|uniref:sensor histidine kinase n=1 Tax=Phenylobacterium sp. TaxID=1871053 RepID=UPI0012290456|nr:sensor histidine kinase [Phenylobacterium sp.]THD60456.1 MAG: sensor histidine kinase [Phenylobacterium sp.]